MEMVRGRDQPRVTAQVGVVIPKMDNRLPLFGIHQMNIKVNFFLY